MQRVAAKATQKNVLIVAAAANESDNLCANDTNTETPGAGNTCPAGFHKVPYDARFGNEWGWASHNWEGPGDNPIVVVEAVDFIDERAEVRLVLGNDVGPFGSGTEHLYRCLRRLALVAPHDGELESTTTHGAVEHDYAILLTAASPGSIPANVWRSSHVIYL